MGKNAWSLVVMAVFMAVGVVGQAPSPSASSSDCTSAITSLAPCLSFVITGSNETKPGNDCCTALSTIVSTKVLCLCQVLSGSNNLGLSINRTQALALPGACNVKTPPVSQCAAAGAPLTSALIPVSSPVSSPKSAKTPAKTPAASTPAPAKATPTPAPGISPVTAASPPSSAPTLSPSAASPPSSAPTLSPSVTPTVSSSSPTAAPPSPSIPSTGTPSSSPTGSSISPGTGTPSSSPAGSGSSIANPPATAPSGKSSGAAIFTPSTLLILVAVALASPRW